MVRPARICLGFRSLYNLIKHSSDSQENSAKRFLSFRVHIFRLSGSDILVSLPERRLFGADLAEFRVNALNLFAGQYRNLLKIIAIHFKKIGCATKEVSFFIKTYRKAEYSVVILYCREFSNYFLA